MSDPLPDVVQLLLREGVVDRTVVDRARDRVNALPAMDRAAESFPGALLVEELVDAGALTPDQAQDAWVRAEPATTLPSGAVRPIPGLPASVSSGVADPMAAVRAGLADAQVPDADDDDDDDQDPDPDPAVRVATAAPAGIPPAVTTPAAVHARWDEQDRVRLRTTAAIVAAALGLAAAGFGAEALLPAKPYSDLADWWSRFFQHIGSHAPWIAALGFFGTLLVPHPRGRGWAGAAGVCSAMIIAFRDRYEVRNMMYDTIGSGPEFEIIYVFGIASAVWALAAFALGTVFVLNLLRDLRDDTGIHLIAMVTIVFTVLLAMLAFGAPQWAVSANAALACALLALAAGRVIQILHALGTAASAQSSSP